nr:DegT/DnrJ/EryC1/StrS family aminotransferase [Chloroflexia bacterium]
PPRRAEAPPPGPRLLPAIAGRMPVLDAVRAYQHAGTMPFSTPGHKLGAGTSDELHDLLGPGVFAADIWLNTAAHDTAVRDAEALAAATWGAGRTFFLVNGSSSGNHAFLLATLSPGDEVVLGRDIHTSLLTALILTGARPIYVAPQLRPELDLGLGPDPAAIAAALNAHPAAKLVVLTSPTYWGITADVAAIAAVAHARGVPLYVDEAWGPHFPFHPNLPPSAIASGADGAVTSPHKLLAGLSQAAMLHAGGPRVDLARLATVVTLTQTTSPLLPILASLDACRQQMAARGEALLDRALALAGSASHRLQRLPGVTVLDAARLGLPPWRHDPTRLVIDVQGLGLTGFEAERRLRQHFGLAPEMSDLLGVVCLITIGDTEASVDRLVAAFAALAAGRRPPRRPGPGNMRSMGEIVAPGRQALTPRDAFFAPTRLVSLAEAAGEVVAELVVPYPPGIPVVAPGEVVTAAKVDYLRQVVARGGLVRGVADPTLRTLRIVAP